MDSAAVSSQRTGQPGSAKTANMPECLVLSSLGNMLICEALKCRHSPSESWEEKFPTSMWHYSHPLLRIKTQRGTGSEEEALAEPLFWPGYVSKQASSFGKKMRQRAALGFLGRVGLSRSPTQHSRDVKAGSDGIMRRKRNPNL